MLSLREVRRRQLLSREDLAERSGVCVTTILTIEHGRRVPRFGTIRRLATALGIDPMQVAEFHLAIAGSGDAVD